LLAVIKIENLNHSYTIKQFGMYSRCECVLFYILIKYNQNQKRSTLSRQSLFRKIWIRNISLLHAKYYKLLFERAANTGVKRSLTIICGILWTLKDNRRQWNFTKIVNVLTHLKIISRSFWWRVGLSQSAEVRPETEGHKWSNLISRGNACLVQE